MVMKPTQKLITELDSGLNSRLKVDNNVWSVDAMDLPFRELNSIMRSLDRNGAQKVELHNVFGQRYIGTDLKRSLEIDIYGTPGNDLAAFMNGQNITVRGNAQDCTANTMNDGQIVIHGRAGDITCYGMRGGRVFVRDDVGYRAGIHMKEYIDKKPYLVVGGTAQDFLGEYMAGGVLLVLGLTLMPGETHKMRFVGTGMHAGVLYVRGEVTNFGEEVKVVDVDARDLVVIEGLVKEYCGYFGSEFKYVMGKKFVKVVPHSHRPYGRVYAY
jgi:glutamate synthase domain-containing protein 3